MPDSVQMQNIRAEHVSRIVTGFALQSYVLKEVTMIKKSSSWKETYFQETAADLTGGTGSAVKGIPRLAKFPYGEVKWQEISNRHQKYGMEGVISWEDIATNEIDVMARTLLRIGRAVAKGVDDEIYTQISDNAGQTFAITSGEEWDATEKANRDPIQNILRAKRLIMEQNYDLTRNTFLLLNPKDMENLLGNPNIRNSGQFFTDSPTKNGTLGRLLGLTVKISNSVTADEAIVIVGQEAVTWQTAHGLSVETMIDPGIKWTVRAWEVGVTQVTNPNAICKITNTAK